jgi:glycosyltransferase involved in cell wall biosynthesis
VVSQDVSEPFEVIVVSSGTDRTASIVRERFPAVTVVELDKPALPGEARNAGLAVARGGVITFPGSHIELLPGSLAARLRAHRRGYAMVTGVVTNGTPTPAGWASYFLDQSETLPGHPAAEFNGPPGHCSYARLPLLEVGGFPEGVRTAEDTAVNRALVARGYVAYRDPNVQFIHYSPCSTTRRLLRHHMQRGRGWGRMLVARHREQGRMLTRAFVRDRLVEALPIRLARIERSVHQARPDIAQQYEAVRPLVVAGAIASWLGMWQEILRPSQGKVEILFGIPVVNLLLA